MGIVAAFDKVLFFNETSKYCVLRLKTADDMIPADAKSPYRYSDHLIRFTAVGYDLPRTNAIQIELDGVWQSCKYGCQLQVERWHEIVPPTLESWSVSRSGFWRSKALQKKNWRISKQGTRRARPCGT